MTRTARTAAGDGLLDDSKIDWPAIRERLATASAILGLPEAEIKAVIAARDEEGAVIEFCKRNDVSLDWMVLGVGAPPSSVRRGGMTKPPHSMSEEQTRELAEIVLRLPRAEQRLVLTIAQALAGLEGQS